MTYVFDLDNTLCATSSSKNYSESIPFLNAINQVNNLRKEGHYIKIFTARGSGSGIDWRDLTKQQLLDWGVEYDELILGKPSYDICVDDKSTNAYDWRVRNGCSITGFVAGTFDLLHAGHCLFLKEAKSVCDYLFAALQTDPTIDHHKDRPLQQPKNKPVQSTDERKIQLEAISYVDKILVYKTENDLLNLIKEIRPNLRILGSDYRNKRATGEEWSEGVIYHQRTPQWSSSELKGRINGN